MQELLNQDTNLIKVQVCKNKYKKILKNHENQHLKAKLFDDLSFKINDKLITKYY